MEQAAVYPGQVVGRCAGKEMNLVGEVLGGDYGVNGKLGLDMATLTTLEECKDCENGG